MSVTLSDMAKTITNSVTPGTGTMGLRAFLRGGYQHVDVPTTITNQSGLTLFTVVPGRIVSKYEWTTEMPTWLRKEG